MFLCSPMSSSIYVHFVLKIHMQREGSSTHNIDSESTNDWFFFQSENKIYLREEKRDSDVLALRVTKTYKMQRAVELRVSQLPSLGVPGAGGKVLNNCLNLKSINYKVSTYFNWQSHCLLLFLSLSLSALFFPSLSPSPFLSITLSLFSSLLSLSVYHFLCVCLSFSLFMALALPLSPPAISTSSLYDSLSLSLWM